MRGSGESGYMALSPLVLWPTWGSEIHCLWTETPRLCSSPGVGHVLHYDCSDSYRMSAATARPVTSAVPGSDFSGEPGFRGRGVAVRGGESPAISCTAHLFLLFLLSQLNDICTSCSQKESLVKCHRLQDEQFFSILHFSPCRLPYTPQVPFFIFKGHCLEIQVQEKVITFSLQVCLSKKNKTQNKNPHIVSGWNTGIVAEGKCC